MRRVVLVLAWVLAGAAAALGQERAWVQIEAQPTLREAEERARAYAGAFPDVAGFRLASGWYAIALGPYTPATAEARLAALRAENLVPADSFVALGEVYRAPFWPAGADPARAPPAAAAPAAGIAAAPPAPPGPPGAPEPPEPPAPPAPPEPPDETAAEARRSEAALDRDQRIALQDALKWFGHYDGALDGAIGPGTRAAMAAWQTAAGFEPTGVMTTRQRAQIFADRARIEAELGLARVTEPEAGIEIALPLALVAFEGYDPPFVQYGPKDGRGLRAVLISLPGDEAALWGLYDILQTLDTVPPDGPRSRGDRSFTIEASGPGVASYATAELTGGLIKGFMLVWPPEQADLAGRALAAMKATFKPVGRLALDPGLVPLDAATRAGMLAGMQVRRPAFSRSGFFVSPDGRVLTVAEAVAGCARITLDDGAEAEVAFTDPALGLALLVPRTPLAPPGVAAFETADPRAGADIAVAGFPFEDAIARPTLTFGAFAAASGLDGEAELRRLTLAARPGDAGGPVLDASGAVIGMLLPRPAGGSRLLPDDVAFAAGAAALAGRLAAAGLTVAAAARDGALAPEDLARRAGRMTVRVGCWRDG
jgi:peptidoglycan hydrolase-like protein with peptidoglycan-binding domain